MPQANGSRRASGFAIVPATAERWADLERLFGVRGACAGCWCMWPRLRGAAFKNGAGEPHRRALRSRVRSGDPPGLLAYHEGEAVAWCALAPREEYPRIESSRVLARVDDVPVWSVVCFFVARSYRKQGMTVRLLRAAIPYARSRGARVLEGYPVEPKSGTTADAFAWTGLASSFRDAGFVEVARRSPTRPIMRFVIRATRAGKPSPRGSGASRARPARG